MSEIFILVIAVLTLLIIVLIILAISLYRSLKGMQDSFNKVAYVTREDTKLYFSEVAEEAKEVYAKSLEANKTVIFDSMGKVIAESSGKMKEVISSAEKEAAQIILSAHQDAESIKGEAKQRSERSFNQMLDEAAKVIDWAMSQYIKDNFTVAEHEEIIRKLITSYRDEQGN